ncbi:hypothetical protein ACJX0J_033587 [Zea mays]
MNYICFILYVCYELYDIFWLYIYIYQNVNLYQILQIRAEVTNRKSSMSILVIKHHGNMLLLIKEDILCAHEIEYDDFHSKKVGKFIGVQGHPKETLCFGWHLDVHRLIDQRDTHKHEELLKGLNRGSDLWQGLGEKEMVLFFNYLFFAMQRFIVDWSELEKNEYSLRTKATPRVLTSGSCF